MLTCSENDFASAMNHPNEDPDFVFETEFEIDDSETDDVTRWEIESKCSKLQRRKKIVTLRCSSRHSFAYRHEFSVLHLSISIKEV